MLRVGKLECKEQGHNLQAFGAPVNIVPEKEKSRLGGHSSEQAHSRHQGTNLGRHATCFEYLQEVLILAVDVTNHSETSGKGELQERGFGEQGWPGRNHVEP